MCLYIYMCKKKGKKTTKKKYIYIRKFLVCSRQRNSSYGAGGVTPHRQLQLRLFRGQCNSLQIRYNEYIQVIYIYIFVYMYISI